jgi:phosphoesterase RecJ-like protein
MPTPYHRAAVHLRHATSVAVCAHVRPDGDAIGSVLGLTLSLRAAGISAVPLLAEDTDPPSTYGFLPGFGLLTPAVEIEQPDVFVALDAPSSGRLGNAETMALAARELIVIDHHPDNEYYGTVNIVESDASATAQLVWRLAERLEIERTADIALCCYTGLVTDTGRFAYDNTTPTALRDAADMIEAGVAPAEVARLIYQERTPAALAIESRVLSRLTKANGGRVVYSWLTDEDYAETGASPSDGEDLPDAVRRIGGVDVAVLLRITGAEVRGNLRAKTGFDVGSVARSFGGGGHAPAAGFTFEGTLEDLLPGLLAQLPGTDDGAAPLS